MIDFNIPPYVDTEIEYIKNAILHNKKTCGDGPYTTSCQKLMESTFDANKILLTTSGTAALEMAMLLCDINCDDEVIMPSFNFVSAADAVVLLKGVPVFVDIRPDTMNIDENKLEAAITSKTKAIVVVHYGGVACEMDTIMAIAKKHGLKVIEDAAHGVNAFYKDRALGTIGDFGCYSFHETKNFSMGEGGAILINDQSMVDMALVVWEKGTDRQKFIAGKVDKYTWIDKGSSFLPSDILAACLYAQLEKMKEITLDRSKSWDLYQKMLLPLENKGIIELPKIPSGCKQNAHMFYIKCKDYSDRQALTRYLYVKGITAVSHYVPLHSSPAGQKYGRFYGKDIYTTKESEKILRLPLYYGLALNDLKIVIENIYDFYNQKIEDCNL